MLEIASADQDENAPGRIVQSDHCSLKIVGGCVVRFTFPKILREFGVGLVIVPGMLLDLIEIFAQRFLGHFLQVGIDGGVNSKTFVHRPVPTDFGDDLLPDVIDRVVLALRVLAIAGHDFLRLCRSRVRAINETEIAHSSKRVIARITRLRAVAPRRQAIRAFD